MWYLGLYLFETIFFSIPYIIIIAVNQIVSYKKNSLLIITIVAT